MVASTRGDIESRGPRAAWYGTAACAALLLILLWSAELQVNSGVHFSLGTLVGLDEGGILATEDSGICSVSSQVLSSSIFHCQFFIPFLFFVLYVAAYYGSQ